MILDLGDLDHRGPGSSRSSRGLGNCLADLAVCGQDSVGEHDYVDEH